MSLSSSVHGKIDRFETALAADLGGVMDDEGRSPLDVLIAEVQRSRDGRKDWASALVDVLEKGAPGEAALWPALERFVVLVDLKDDRLARVLEELLARGTVPVEGRASLYAILDKLGYSPSAQIVYADAELKTSDRVRWLDLVIRRLPDPVKAQGLVVDAIRDGEFSMQNFLQRLNTMRKVGGEGLAEWIGLIRSELQRDDLGKFDFVMNEAFGLHPTQPQAVVKEQGEPLYSMVSDAELWKSDEAPTPVHVPYRGREKTIVHAQRIVSENISAEIQYTYVAAQLHLGLRRAMDGRSRDPASIRRLLTDLLDHLNLEFYQVVEHTFGNLKAFFTGRNGGVPRMCVKGNFPVDGIDKVISIFRDKPVPYVSDVPIRENTGFQFIRDTGRFFLENRIPEAILKRGYVNPRIDTSEIRKRFGKTPWECKRLSKEWELHWRDVNHKRVAKSACYRSTLIVPLTLWNTTVRRKFVDTVHVSSIDKSIFGYLCLDHIKEDYFVKTVDPFVLKLVADSLGAFVFTRMRYTDFSDTFERANAFLDKKNTKAKTHQIDQIRKVSPRVAVAFPKAPKPKKLGAISADSALVKFARPKLKQETAANILAITRAGKEVADA